MKKLVWDVDDGPKRFRHRVILFEDGALVRTGGWTTYEGIAHLEHDGHHYHAATAMYDGCLPTECVFESLKVTP